MNNKGFLIEALMRLAERKDLPDFEAEAVTIRAGEIPDLRALEMPADLNPSANSDPWRRQGKRRGRLAR